MSSNDSTSSRSNGQNEASQTSQINQRMRMNASHQHQSHRSHASHAPHASNATHSPQVSQQMMHSQPSQQSQQQQPLRNNLPQSRVQQSAGTIGKFDVVSNFNYYNDQESVAGSVASHTLGRRDAGSVASGASGASGTSNFTSHTRGLTPMWQTSQSTIPSVVPDRNSTPNKSAARTHQPNQPNGASSSLSAARVAGGAGGAGGAQFSPTSFVAPSAIEETSNEYDQYEQKVREKELQKMEQDKSVRVYDHGDIENWNEARAVSVDSVGGTGYADNSGEGASAHKVDAVVVSTAVDANAVGDMDSVGALGAVGAAGSVGRDQSTTNQLNFEHQNIENQKGNSLSKDQPRKKKRMIIILTVTILLIVGLAIGLAMGLTQSNSGAVGSVDTSDLAANDEGTSGGSGAGTSEDEGRGSGSGAVPSAGATTTMASSTKGTAATAATAATPPAGAAATTLTTSATSETSATKPGLSGQTDAVANEEDLCPGDTGNTDYYPLEIYARSIYIPPSDMGESIQWFIVDGQSKEVGSGTMGMEELSKEEYGMIIGSLKCLEKGRYVFQVGYGTPPSTSASAEDFGNNGKNDRMLDEEGATVLFELYTNVHASKKETVVKRMTILSETVSFSSQDKLQYNMPSFDFILPVPPISIDLGAMQSNNSSISGLPVLEESEGPTDEGTSFSSTSSTVAASATSSTSSAFGFSWTTQATAASTTKRPQTSTHSSTSTKPPLGDVDYPSVEEDHDIETIEEKSCYDMEVTLSTDDYGGETLLFFGYTVDDIYTMSPHGPFRSDSVYVLSSCLEPEEYRFEIFDIENDGICCEHGKGRITLKLDGERIWIADEFGTLSAITFLVPFDSRKLHLFDLHLDIPNSYGASWIEWTLYNEKNEKVFHNLFNYGAGLSYQEATYLPKGKYALSIIDGYRFGFDSGSFEIFVDREFYAGYDFSWISGESVEIIDVIIE